jgi:UDP-N-acetylglucosamine 2-epimerase
VKKIVSIVGARPQFVKCGSLSSELRKVANEILVHTGQHYDDNLSEVFFRELHLPKPDYHLGVGSGTHGQQTAEMLRKIEELLLTEEPHGVLVYGDTNSTLAGALAAAKLHVPVAHLEAGLRSFNRWMPEEINRVMTDHLSSVLLCPTETAVSNLAREGVAKDVYLIGDVMFDALADHVEVGKATSTILDRLHLEPKAFLLATVHRPENTDNVESLQNIMEALLTLARSGQTVVFPLHPRTRRRLDDLLLTPCETLHMIEPVPYLDMVCLESYARVILTDSGGVQKEAYWLGVPCVTLRKETEWIETVESGWNRLVGADLPGILNAVENAKPGHSATWPWGKGEASKRGASIIGQMCSAEAKYC